MFFFFFNDTATTEIYTLSLHDALPIWVLRGLCPVREPGHRCGRAHDARALRRAVAHSAAAGVEDRKSTRLNSSHANISYAVFCLKKKNISQSYLHLPVFDLSSTFRYFP